MTQAFTVFSLLVPAVGLEPIRNVITTPFTDIVSQP